jgi:hypothetical protein
VTGQIVAMGGHALEEHWSRPLEDFALALTGKARPRLLLLAQATAERESMSARSTSASQTGRR